MSRDTCGFARTNFWISFQDLVLACRDYTSPWLRFCEPIAPRYMANEYMSIYTGSFMYNIDKDLSPGRTILNVISPRIYAED